MLWLLLVVILVAFLLFCLSGKKRRRGRRFENRVCKRLVKLPDEYHVMDNLLLEYQGRSAQRDHLIVSPYGLFVIEDKNYKGWIIGGEEAEYWTQTIYSRKNQLYNPIRQNEGHLRFLSYLFRDIGRIPMIPIVVFGDEAELKVNVREHIVIHRNALLKVISRYRESVIPDRLMYKILATLTQYLKVDRRAEKRHIQSAKIKKRDSLDKIRQGICPRCGGSLVKRQGPYGTFYGCSNYPRCKFYISKLT
ncbi:MAG: NERD domain-containing protein [Porphyromonadaceae bacterium]|nr:NERD domain-containing protein [Porphyromonadaceae bacterium]